MIKNKYNIGEMVEILPFELLERDNYVGDMEKYINNIGKIIKIEPDECNANKIIYEVLFWNESWFFDEVDLKSITKNKNRDFEIVSYYKDKLDESFLPQRADKGSAGYDIRAAEDILVPSILKQYVCYFEKQQDGGIKNLTLEQAQKKIPELKIGSVLVPTGMKAKFLQDEVLEIVPRSSTGIKTLLTMPNNTGIIDSSYYNNSNNEGHIFVGLINMSPFDILIKKGDKIAQGIFKKYEKTYNDNPYKNKRTGGIGSTGVNNK